MDGDTSVPAREEETMIVGIDPGKSGAIAVFGRSVCGYPPDTYVSQGGAIIGVWDMPLTAERDIDTVALRQILSEIAKPFDIFVEHQQPHAITGKVAAWENGYQYRGVIEACRGFVYREIKPQEWMRSLGCLGNKTMSQKDKKRLHCELAARLFPDLQLKGPKGGWLDGRADALLIAEYGRRLLAR